MADEEIADAEVLADTEGDETDAIVDRWFNDSFHDRGVQTEFYNLVLAAKEDLKKRLKEV